VNHCTSVTENGYQNTNYIGLKTYDAYDAKPESAEKEFLTLRYEQMVQANKLTKARAIDIISNAERRSRVFAAYRKLTKPRASGGISYVLEQTKVGTDDKGDPIFETTRINTKADLEKRLYERNRVHFSQAQGTPFTIPPLSDELGFDGATKFGEGVLRGDPIPDTMNIPRSARLLLAELKQVRPAMDCQLPFEDMVAGFRKWKEATSTSPSGKHLGVYKSLVNAYLNGLRTETESNIEGPLSMSIAKKCLQIQHFLINLAIQHTHTFNRWKVVHNIFLEKLPGTPLVDKLRVLHIYEADWNLILKYYWAQKLTKVACNAGTVTTEQVGG
jgi:hypothetical protein